MNMEKKFDDVKNPKHYTDRKIEVIDYIEDCGFLEGFCLGNTIKYISRAGKKDPNKRIEDLEKAKWYLDHYIEFLKKNHSEDMESDIDKIMSLYLEEFLNDKQR